MSVLALKLWELAEKLDERLDAPSEVLESLITLLAKGESANEVWSKLHNAAARFDKTRELAQSYEQVTHDKRIKLLSPDQQSFVFQQAAQFFVEVFRDPEGAIAYAERAVAAHPSDGQAFALLERLLTENARHGRLAELYAQASERETDSEKRFTFSYRAFTTAVSVDMPNDFVIELGTRILKLNPADGEVRDEVMRRLLVEGRHRDVIALLEQALAREPGPAPEEETLHREQLVDLCFSVLNDPARALTHVEGLLALDPAHPTAQKAARDLLANPELMLRAAGALSDASEKVGDRERAIEMLELELEHVRGPRRVEVQRRLGILRQDALGDREGALELIGPVVAGDPGDDALRERFVGLHMALNQPEQAARLLARALGKERDPAVRARVELDIGNIYLYAKDPKRATDAFARVLELGADDAASLAAARELVELFGESGDQAELARVLETVVRLEPEREERQVAARKLAQLSEESGVVPHRERSIVALRALVGSPWTEEALEKLDRIYQEAGDSMGLADVLLFRAERGGVDGATRAELGARALELYSSAAPSDEAKLQAYRNYTKIFGASRQVNALSIPLIEGLGRYAELDEVLSGEIELASPEEQAALWFRLAELRLRHLGNVEGGLDALSWAIALDPDDERVRSELERLLDEPTTRLRAAGILEPLYRRKRAMSGLFHVLETRVVSEQDPVSRLTLAEEAVRAALESTNARAQAFELAGRALIDALESAPERIPAWLSLIDSLVQATENPKERARLLAQALGTRTVDSRPLFILARALGDALVQSSDAAAALVAYRRALAFDPNDAATQAALVDVLLSSGDHAAAMRQIEGVLPTLSGPERVSALLRLAEAELRAGERVQALAHYRELAVAGALVRDKLAEVERLAAEQGDGETLVLVLSRELAQATSPERPGLLERLGDAEERVRGDFKAACQHFLESARLAQATGDGERARRLYERVLANDPNELEAARAVIELAATVADFARVRDAFEGVLRTANEDELLALLSSLAQPAQAAGAELTYAELVDRALARGLSAERTYDLKFAKACLLSRTKDGRHLARELFQSLLATPGSDPDPVLEAFSSFVSESPPSPERSEDLRSLYAFQVARSPEPLELWSAWARAEETELGEPERAIALYEQITARYPNDLESYFELARLRQECGNDMGALEALGVLQQRAKDEDRRVAELATAEILLNRLGRGEEALDLVAPILAVSPAERDALRIVLDALAHEQLLERATGLVERAIEAGGSSVIEALLSASADMPALADARRGWTSQLLSAASTDQPEARLAFALRAAEAAPAERDPWELAEQLTRDLGNPEPLREAYERVFTRPLSPDLADELGRSMVEFNEEWYDDPERIIRLIERVLELSPRADWAFDRLKLAFNAAARWQELFRLYDARLSATSERELRVDLLREAAMAARDFADDAERGISYLEALNRENPGDARVESSLERLYERHAKKRPLIELLSTRHAGLTDDEERSALERRIAVLWLELEEAVPALELAYTLFDRPAHAETAIDLMERALTLPSCAVARPDGSRPLFVATSKLKSYYTAKTRMADVVRILSLEEQAAENPAERRPLLEQIVRLRVRELKDLRGAFDALSELVLLDPESASYRKSLADLGRRIGAEPRRAEVLVEAARAASRASLRSGLLNEAASVYRHALGNDVRAIELYREVLSEVDVPPPVALLSARELTLLLRNDGDPLERTALLERLADLEQEPAQRRAALGEAAELALGRLSDPARAIENYRKCIADDANDLAAMDGLCRALEVSGSFEALVEALEARAQIQSPTAARADRVRIAELYASELSDRATAIEAWRRVVELHGADRLSFQALSTLLTEEQRYPELAELIVQEIQGREDPEERRALYLELGALHEERTLDRYKALEAFVAAGAWQAAVRVTSATAASGPLEWTRHSRRLLELAVQAWQLEGSESDSEPACAADFALDAFCRGASEAGEFESVVERLLSCAALPFSTRRRRELVHEAGNIAADRLNDGERAIGLFQGLIDEDPADEVADACVPRLAELLTEQGRFDVIATLWETQAAAHVGRDNVKEAQVLWARAGSIAEERLEDLERALSDYEQGAEIGGEACLEALARVFRAEGQMDQVARALERLAELSSKEALPARALELADTYLVLERPKLARKALEQALERVEDGAALREKLAVIYRGAEDHAALAALFEQEAKLSSDPARALAFLKEAADLHLYKRGQPSAAVPLLERALELDSGDSALRLRLARALHDSGRYEEGARALRDQLARYGARRPKDRALVHYELARVLVAANDRAGALAELEAGSRIDPAQPRILHMLARTALEEGDLARAERMYRALLLIAPKENDADAPSKSEALVALAEIAKTRGDELRAEEFVASAFEAGQTSTREARALEDALRGHGRPELLARALELRLKHGTSLKEAARCLGDLCELHERALGDLDRVRGDLQSRANQLEEELLRRDSSDDEAWSALGRSFAALGEIEAEGRILERRVTFSSRSSRPEHGPDLYFRLAELRLSDPATFDQGLDLLDRGLLVGLSPEHAEALLHRVFPEGHEPPRVLDLFERSARAKGDKRGLLRVLIRRVGSGEAGILRVREGVALAEELEQPVLVDELLGKALAAPTGGIAVSDAAWLRLTLAERKRRAGDVEHAILLEEEAAEYLPPFEARALLERVANEALTRKDDLRAIRLFATLHRDNPGNPALFEPLIELYRKTGQIIQLVDLLDATARFVQPTEQRTRLRLEQVELLLNHLDRKNEALILLREVVESDPKERRARTLLIELFDAEGKEDELIELFDAEIAAQRERGDLEAATQLVLRLVVWLERHGRVRDAIQACQAGLAHDPARRELGDALLGLAEASGDTELVADALERLLRAGSGENASELCWRLVAIREQNSDSAGVLRALELGFAANPGEAELVERLAAWYTGSGDTARVAELYERALEHRPDDPRLLQHQIEAYRAAGRTEQALSALDKLREAQPEASFVRQTRAALLGDLGRYREAVLELEGAASADPALSTELVRLLRRALDHADPEEAPALGLKLADALERSGDRTGAERELTRLLELKPDSPELLLRLGELEVNAGNDERAIEIFSRLVELSEGAAVVAPALELAQLSERLGRPALARPALERALSIEPGNAEVRTRLVGVLEADGAYRALAELLREEADREPRRDERARKLLRVGELLLYPDGDVMASVSVLESIREDLKDSIELVVLLGRAYSFAGQNEQALAVLNSCIDAHRGKRLRALGAVYEQKADVHLEDGDGRNGLQALAKAFELDPKNARVGMRLASLAVESEELEMAQRALRAVAIMRTAPIDGPDGARLETKAEANFTLAELAQRAGDPRKARVLAAKALSENPDHEKARVLLKALEAR